MTNNQLIPIIVAFAAALCCWIVVWKRNRNK